MKRENFNDYRLPKPIVFGFLFVCSFLPGNMGKASAALAGLVLALWLLGFFGGRVRFVLALLFPVICCLLVRLASYGIYMCMADQSAMDALAIKARHAAAYAGALLNALSHYVSRLWETAWGLRDAVSGFAKTGKAECLAPVRENAMFVVILFSILVCLASAKLRKE